ncbi:hypothetical protein AGMMS49546_02380 [Spirochaetia bacterium]|nr:hypothetical protein AGMMS49546_02380 [Spirochaetia bacterium]
MKNYKVIFMGMLALALVFGLAGCQNPAASGTYLDGTLANIGPNVLGNQGAVFQGPTTSLADAITYTEFKLDGTWLSWAKLDTAILSLPTIYSYQQALSGSGTWTKVLAGTYTWNTPRQKITFRTLRQYPATAGALKSYGDVFTAAQVDGSVISSSTTLNNAVDSDGLVDSVAQGNVMRGYLLGNPDKYLDLYRQGYRLENGNLAGQNLSATVADILDGKGYSTLSSYINDYYSIDSWGVQEQSFYFKTGSKTAVYF